MDRLGYDRYGVQGGDFGSLISAAVSRTAPDPTPTGIAVFPGDTTVRRYAERVHNVVHWPEFERGGHYTALQAPGLLAADIRTFFAALT